MVIRYSLYYYFYDFYIREKIAIVIAITSSRYIIIETAVLTLAKGEEIRL